MDQWHFRAVQQNDWISLLYLLNLIALVLMQINDRVRFRNLLRLFNHTIYFGNHALDKNLNYFSIFNGASFFIIINTLSISLYTFLQIKGAPPFFAFEFYYVFLTLLLFLVLRFLFVHFIVQAIDRQGQLKAVFFRSLTYQLQACIFALPPLIVFYFNPYPTALLISFFCLPLLIWCYFHLRLYIRYFVSHSNHLLYLIFYLCTIKIAPWLWFYLIIIEPRL